MILESPATLLPLTPHPVHRPIAVNAVAVSLRMLDADALEITYRVAGRIAEIAVPSKQPARRSEGLWQHSCFEIFLGSPNGSSYLEFNFSPSSQWACYEFAGYRSGGTNREMLVRPVNQCECSARTIELTATVFLGQDWLLRMQPFRIGLAAVVEEASGALSYWALKHVTPQPDFHREQCWLLEFQHSETNGGGWVYNIEL